MSPATPGLAGVRILVVEDDYYLATDLQEAMEQAGAKVIGPFPDAPEAMRLITTDPPDCAFVDVNLGLGPSFELPRELMKRGVPFAFVTGYDANVIPVEFASAERIEKPVSSDKVAAVAARLMQSRV